MADSPEILHNYQNHHLDSTRWESYRPRSDDIVVSTSYKSGTTWMQAILVNLVFQGREVPDVFDTSTTTSGLLLELASPKSLLAMPDPRYLLEAFGLPSRHGSVRMAFEARRPTRLQNGRFSCGEMVCDEQGQIRRGDSPHSVSRVLRSAPRDWPATRRSPRPKVGGPRDFKPALKRAGLPSTVGPYDLRHTHATLLLLAGIHPKIVSSRLGHADISLSLNTSSHVLPGMQRESAEEINAMLFERPSARVVEGAT